MKAICRKTGGWVGLVGILLSITVPAQAGLIQPVSLLGSNQTPPVGGNGDSGLPILSQDGRYVTFSSTANNLVLLNNSAPIPMLVPARFNAFLRDRTNKTTSLISINTSGTAGGDGDSFPVNLSTNGQFALFESSASDLVGGDTNKAADLSPDGRFVSFRTLATNVVAGGSGITRQIVLGDRQTGSNTLVSASRFTGGPGDDHSLRANFSGDGQTLLIQS